MKKITPAAPVFDRIKEYLRVSTDKDLRDAWPLKRPTLDLWKKNDSIPEPALLKFAEEHGLSLEWLTTGEGPKYKIEPILDAPTFINEELSKQIAAHVAESMPTYGKDPRTVKLCKAFDALDDKDKEEVIKEIMPYIKARL